jgi:hypothetical protein
MAEVFVSHVEADSDAAGQLAAALESAGFTVGRSHPPAGAASALPGRARAVVVLVSPDSLGSPQMTAEIGSAAEGGLPFVPVLAGLTHADLAERAPEWRAALGTAALIEVPRDGVPDVAPRVVDGVRALVAPAPSSSRRSRRRVLAAVAAAALVAAGAGGVWLSTRGGGEETRSSADTSASPSTTVAPPGGPSATPPSGTPIPRSTESVTPGPLADAATTPLKTVAGDLRVNRTRVTTEFCPQNGECVRTTGSDRLVVLRVTEWTGRDLPFTEAFAKEMDRAYVRAGEARATFVNAQQDPGHGSWEIVYTALPVSALAGQVEIVWPGSPTLVLHPQGR